MWVRAERKGKSTNSHLSMGAAQETQSPGVFHDCGQLDRFSLWTITLGREELSATSKFKGFPGKSVLVVS